MPEKQLDVLLQAVQYLPPTLNATLRVIGEGSQLHVLKHLARELGIGDRVVFVGYAPEDEKRSALAAATVFAIPFVAELHSIRSLEAMTSGLPVVATKALAFPHPVNGNVYLFKAGNTADLAEKLTQVLSADDEAYLSMRRQGRKMAEAQDIERTIDSFEALYQGKRRDEG
jgi:glycosyltransferase involved in cell wall biosynthesis